MRKHNPMRVRFTLFLALVLMSVSILSACGNDPATETTPAQTTPPSETADAPSTTAPATAAPETTAPAEVAPIEGAAHVKVNSSETMQTIDGFGAGFTWYSSYAFTNPYKEEILAALFDDAAFSILRFKNEYGYPGFESSAKTNLAYYEYAKAAAEKRGEEIQILYTSWSPTADLKSNNSINGGGSLAKDANGNYVYDGFADWWVDSVKAYREKGIAVDYVSIQNECDFTASYDGCEFDASETTNRASYADAFLATYHKFTDTFGDSIPKMLGPETMSVEPGTLKAYMQKVMTEAPESVYGIAHHLYLGGTSSDEPNNCNADSFLLNFMGDAEYIKEHNLKAWQTEFYRGTPIQTANVINNSLVYENASAYIYWGGVWEGKKTDNLLTNTLVPIGRSMPDWPGPHGYLLTGDYYVMRHFSEFIRPGYVRIDATHDGELSLRMSGYMSPNKDRIVLVLINNADEITTQLTDLGMNVTGSVIRQSVLAKDFTEEDLYKDLGALPENLAITLPAASVTTVVLDGSIQ